MKLSVFIPILFLLTACGPDDPRNVRPANQIAAIDPQRACASLPAGSLCGGGKYIGEVGGTKYVTTQAGCTNAITPTCDDVLDFDLYERENGFGTQPALEYCRDMVYNGHSDWVLPDIAVLSEMYNQQNAIGGFVAQKYWSMDQFNLDEFYALDFSDGSNSWWWEDDDYNVRCVRISTI